MCKVLLITAYMSLGQAQPYVEAYCYQTKEQCESNAAYQKGEYPLANLSTMCFIIPEKLNPKALEKLQD